MVSGGHTFTAIDGGSNYTCAISNGALYCWGGAPSGYTTTFGELGNGTTSFSGVPALVLGGRTYTWISAGNFATSCGIASGGGAAYCWGLNQFGQLGAGTNTGP